MAKIADGSHPFLKKLEGAERPMLIIGQGALARGDGVSMLALAAKAAIAIGALKPDLAWNGFNVLHAAAGRVAGLDLGFVPGRGGLDVDAMLDAAGNGKIEIVYLLGADEIDMERLGKAFVIYQGSHGDKGAHRADVILPGAAYTEKDGTYVNTEGRTQMAARAVFPPGEAREDWTILRALSAVLGNAFAVRHDTAASRQDVRGASASGTARPDRSGRCRRDRAPRQDARKVGKERFGTRGRRLLFHQPGRACLGRHGEFERAAFQAQRQGNRHRWLSSGRARACRSRSSWCRVAAILVTLLIIVAFLLYADRKVWAAVQTAARA